ncbi:MAG: hypothetical protein II901_00130 [Paludibacteraceae bacterium]|nr:hypothetical protein [Paludibacteraceae bacterium]
MMQHISKIEIAERLDEVLGAQVGMQGLNTLLYGWTRKDPQLRTNIRHRTWLFRYEVKELSAYAGYDLRPRKSNSICEAG